MREDVILVFLVIIFFAVVAFTIISQNTANRKRFIARIQQMWGTFSDREYTERELECISHYAMRKMEEGFSLDEITWNDLDMNRIYMQMNQTVSSPGEDYLYSLLRQPQFDESVLKERSRLIRFFEGAVKERETLQSILGKVVCRRGISVSDSVYVLQDVVYRGVWKDLLMAMLAVFSIILFFITPKIGIYLFIAVMVFNIGTYLLEKGEIEPYRICFLNILLLLNAAKEIKKLDMPAISHYQQSIAKSEKALSKFKKGSILVTTNIGAISGLEGVFMDYIRMFFHADLIKFDSLLKEVLAHREEIDSLIADIGMLDSMIAIASYRKALPYYCEPVLSEHKQGHSAVLEVKNLYHPLIKEPVANSIRVERGTLVTGSNASGKSTFLKNMAINAIFAQSIYTCVASGYEAPCVRIMTSMALRDDLQGGESYYIVEIKSLNRILTAAKEETPLLCVIDEVLRGTNTIERIAASSRILAALHQPHVLTFAATHDIELSYILESSYQNYHFEEEVKKEDVVFNYLLKKGRASTRNAIKLLEMIGYDKQIVNAAKKAAQEFEENGVWTNIERRQGRC